MGLFVQNMGHHLLIIKQPIVFSDFQVGDFQDCLQMLVYFTLSRHKGWAHRSPICGPLGKSMISTAGNPSMYPANEIWYEYVYVMVVPGGCVYDAKLNVATVHSHCPSLAAGTLDFQNPQMMLSSRLQFECIIDVSELRAVDVPLQFLSCIHPGKHGSNWSPSRRAWTSSLPALILPIHSESAPL